jgi:hypothetical protein
LLDFDESSFGPRPWSAASDGVSSDEFLRRNWELFSELHRLHHANSSWYAEKVSYWLPSFVRAVLPCKVIHLVRDPRDVWLSIRSFARRRATEGFGAELEECEQARWIAHQWLCFAENERADLGRSDAIILPYEDIARDLAGVAKRLGAWLGLELMPDSGDVTRHIGHHATSDSPGGSVSRWQREQIPEPIAERLIAPLVPELARYGYAPSEVQAAPRLEPRAEWPHSPDARYEDEGRGLRVTVTGPDAWFELPARALRAEDVAEVWICVSGGTGDCFSIYWRPPGEHYAELRSLHVPYLPGTHRQIVRIPVRPHQLWAGTIEQIRIDVFNGKHVANRPGTVHWVQLVR